MAGVIYGEIFLFDKENEMVLDRFYFEAQGNYELLVNPGTDIDSVVRADFRESVFQALADSVSLRYGGLFVVSNDQ